MDSLRTELPKWSRNACPLPKFGKTCFYYAFELVFWRQKPEFKSCLGTHELCDFTLLSLCLFVCIYGASLVAQAVKRLPAMRETRVQFLGREDPLEKEMTIHSSTLAWKISWMEEPDRLQFHGVEKSWTRLSDFTFTFTLWGNNTHLSRWLKALSEMRRHPCPVLTHNKFLKKKKKTQLFSAVLGRLCCVKAFSSCGKSGLLSSCGVQPSHSSDDSSLQNTGSRSRGLGSCGAQA